MLLTAVTSLFHIQCTQMICTLKVTLVQRNLHSKNKNRSSITKYTDLFCCSACCFIVPFLSPTGHHGGQVSAHLINNGCQTYMRLLCEGLVSRRLMFRRKSAKITTGSSSYFRRVSFIRFRTNPLLQESKINCDLVSRIKGKTQIEGVP